MTSETPTEPSQTEFALRRALPPEYYTAIGQLVTRWAIIEFALVKLVCAALEIDLKEGRAAIRTPRAVEQIQMIENILLIKGAETDIDWTVVKEQLKEMEAFRNKLSHSVWVERPEVSNPVLLDHSAAYILDRPSGRNMRINPLQVEVHLEQIEVLIGHMEKFIDIGPQLLSKIEAAVSSSQ